MAKTASSDLYSEPKASGTFRSVRPCISDHGDGSSLRAGVSEMTVQRFARCGEFLLVALLLYSALMHYQYATIVASLEPEWIPWPLFWAYFTGGAMLAAGISFILHIQTQRAAVLLTGLFLSYLVFVHAPHLVSGFVNQPQDASTLWASNGTGGINNALKDFALTLSALFLAAAYRRGSNELVLYAKLAATLFGGVMIVFGVEHFLLTDYTPGIPSVSTMSFWMPWLPFWGYLTGAVMLLAGSLIIFGKRMIEATLALGILIFTAASLTYILRAQAHAGSIPEFINLLKDLGVAGGALILAKVMRQLELDS